MPNPEDFPVIMLRVLIHAIEKCKEVRGIGDSRLCANIIAKHGDSLEDAKPLSRGTLLKLYNWDGGEQSPTFRVAHIIARGLVDNFNLEDADKSRQMFLDALDEGMAIHWYGEKPDQKTQEPA